MFAFLKPTSQAKQAPIRLIVVASAEQGFGQNPETRWLNAASFPMILNQATPGSRFESLGFGADVAARTGTARRAGRTGGWCARCLFADTDEESAEASTAT